MSLFKLAMSYGALINLEPLRTNTAKERSSELCMLHAGCLVQQDQTKHRLMDFKGYLIFLVSSS